MATSAPLSPFSGGSTAWSVPFELTEDTSYYWRATARDPHGAIATSGWFRLFVNLSNNGPTMPLPLSPINGDTVGSTAVDLIVQLASDPEGDPLSYLFEIDSVPTFDSPAIRRGVTAASSSQGVSFHIEDLEENTHYAWRVKASDGAAESGWAQGSFFVNVQNDPPSTPSVKNPGNGAWIETLVPLLQLYSAVDPDGEYLTYHFELYSDASLTTRVAEGATNTPQWAPPNALMDNSTYYWRAIAEDPSGALSASWTAIHSFFVTIL